MFIYHREGQMWTSQFIDCCISRAFSKGTADIYWFKLQNTQFTVLILRYNLMALVSFSDAGRRGNSVEISRNKPILSHLVVHLLSIVSCRHRSLEWYLPGINGSLNVKNTGSTWLWHGAAAPGTEQTHVFCAGRSQAMLKISMLTPLRRDTGSRGWGALALQTEGCKHMCSPCPSPGTPSFTLHPHARSGVSSGHVSAHTTLFLPPLFVYSSSPPSHLALCPSLPIAGSSGGALSTRMGLHTLTRQTFPPCVPET